MRNLFRAVALLILILAAEPARAQSYQAIAACPGATAIQPVNSSGAIALVDVNGNLCISGTIATTPGGTQNVNLTQILGAAPSLTNPLWVFPATGATFPVSGTVAATQSGTWTVQPGNTPNTTPWLVTKIPSAAAVAGLTPTTSAALAANTVIKASAGNLYSFEVSANSTLAAAAWWIMIYNATSAPADGAVTPLKCYAMPLGTTAFAAAFPTPVAFSTGITIGVSTTGCFTKTASTNAFISGDAQ